MKCCWGLRKYSSYQEAVTAHFHIYQTEWLNSWIVLYYGNLEEIEQMMGNAKTSHSGQSDLTVSPACWIGSYSSFIFLPVMMHPLLHLWPRSYGSEHITAMADCCLHWLSDTDFWGYLEMAKTWWTRWLFHVLSQWEDWVHGPGSRQKQITLRIGVINLFWGLC